MSETSALATLSTATRMLAEARSLDEVKKIRDIAEAAKAYARAAKLGDEAIGYASAIKLDAERKAGQMLAEMRKKGERSTGAGTHESTGPVLSDLGVTKRESSDWQGLAALPEPEYQEVRKKVQRRTRAASKPKVKPDEDMFERAADNLFTDAEKARRALDPVLLTLVPTAQAVREWKDFLTDQDRQRIEQHIASLVESVRRKGLEVVR